MMTEKVADDVEFLSTSSDGDTTGNFVTLSQHFSNLFFCDPKLLKLMIYKYDCMQINLSEHILKQHELLCKPTMTVQFLVVYV